MHSKCTLVMQSVALQLVTLYFSILYDEYPGISAIFLSWLIK